MLFSLGKWCSNHEFMRSTVLGVADACMLALAYSMNAPPTVDVGSRTDPLDIAMKELEQGKVPIIVRRYLPDRSYEDWKVSELVVDPSL